MHGWLNEQSMISPDNNVIHMFAIDKLQFRVVENATLNNPINFVFPISQSHIRVKLVAIYFVI